MTSTVSPSPEQPGDLVVRLRKPDAWSAHFHGGGSFTTAEEAAPFEAADALESAQAEIARLTAALEAISTFQANGSGANYYFEETWRLVDIARAALKAKPAMTSDKTMAEEMARAIREEQVRQYRDNDRDNCPAGAAYYEEHIGPYALAQAAATIAQRRVGEAYRDWFDKGHAVGFREGARAALNPKGE